MEDVVVRLAEFAEDGICVAATDGSKAHDSIIAEIRRGRRVVISFSGVTRLTTAFLNAAVGRLYGELTADQIREHLAPPADCEPMHLSLLKLSVDRAKSYFRDPNAAKVSFTSVTGMDDVERH